VNLERGGVFLGKKRDENHSLRGCIRGKGRSLFLVGEPPPNAAAWKLPKSWPEKSPKGGTPCQRISVFCKETALEAYIKKLDRKKKRMRMGGVNRRKDWGG